MRRTGWVFGLAALAVGIGLFHQGGYPPATGPEESIALGKDSELERAAEEGARRDQLAHEAVEHHRAEAVAHHRTEAGGFRGWLRRLRRKA